jgi:hypothetical protein
MRRVISFSGVLWRCRSFFAVAFTVVIEARQSTRNCSFRDAITAKQIPILSISVNNDVNNNLFRLLMSIDHPVNKILVQIGSTNSTLIASILNSVMVAMKLKPELPVEISVRRFNPGSAGGFNHGLAALHQSDSSVQWIIIANGDVAFYRGVLNKVVRQVESALLTGNYLLYGGTCAKNRPPLYVSRRRELRQGLGGEMLASSMA